VVLRNLFFNLEVGKMAKMLIVYYSRSGNTEKMAELVKQGAESAGAEVTLKRVEKTSPDELLEYDGILMGSPVYYGTMAAELKKLLDESVKFHGKLDGRVGGAFASSAQVGGGNETTIMDIIKALMIHGMVCQGDPQGDHYGPVAIGAPDARSADGCKRYGTRMAKLTAKMTG
jgi:NAD(P)H dehydrogenase (quinone)